ncbi:MAG: AraC family transcriptional regulator, partial [Clostridia bacterium]|nr:AraC family transcriptional regulator [Clostridia bacterium]
MNKKTKKYIGAALGVLGVAGTLVVASEFFFTLGFVNRKGRNPSPDMSVWDPEATQTTASASVRNMKRRRYKNVMDPESVKRREYANRKKDEGRAWILSKDPERWNITSDDGIPLVAHYIPAENAKAVFILVHGYRSNGLRDFAYIAKPLYATDVARKFGYSKWYFCDKFKKYTGKSFVEYVRHYRISLAAAE